MIRLPDGYEDYAMRINFILYVQKKGERKMWKILEDIVLS